MTLSLAFLSPTIVKAAIEGALPGGLGVASLTELPADWERQVDMILSLYAEPSPTSATPGSNLSRLASDSA